MGPQSGERDLPLGHFTVSNVPDACVAAARRVRVDCPDDYENGGCMSTGFVRWAAMSMAAAVALAGCASKTVVVTASSAPTTAAQVTTVPPITTTTPATTGDYPAEAVSAFIDGCVQGGGVPSRCQGAIDKIQAVIPYEQYVQDDQAAQAGADLPQQYKDIIAQC